MKSSRMFVASSNYRGYEPNLLTKSITHPPGDTLSIISRVQLTSIVRSTHWATLGTGCPRAAALRNLQHLEIMNFCFYFKIPFSRRIFIFTYTCSPHSHALCDSLHISMIFNLRVTRKSEYTCQNSRVLNMTEI